MCTHTPRQKCLFAHKEVMCAFFFYVYAYMST